MPTAGKKAGQKHGHDTHGATVSRKAEHVKVTLKKDVKYAHGTGFSDIEFIHNALPEIDFAGIDTHAEFLGKRLSAPLIISSMTGGYAGAEKINLGLAEAAQEAGIAMGLGSQRAMIERKDLGFTYAIRKRAPSIPIFGNLGIFQLKRYSPRQIAEALQTIEADALAVHINPLQEIIQPEGDRDFFGCLRALEQACSQIGVPVIAKEVGAGISGEVAKRLAEAGVKYVDVSGSGGTSWSAVELERGGMHNEYRNWGFPTATALVDVARSVKVPIIASGGIRSGLDIAKGIALGATYGAAAHPFLVAVSKGGTKGALRELEFWKESLKIAMFLTGSRNLQELGRAPLLITGKTAENFRAMGVDIARYAQR